MKIYKAMVFLDTPDGAIYQMDVIQHDGRFWLVPMWIESPSEGWKKPARIICLDTLKHQKSIGSPTADFVLNVPLSKAVCDGRFLPLAKSEYITVEAPNIRIDIPKGIH